MRGTAQQPARTGAHEADRDAARAVVALKRTGQDEGASDRYAEIVQRHQRRASRIAFHYLRDAADADDAVQDAFIKAFVNLETYRDEMPFEVWFTRILVNGCLDRIKARTRRGRLLVPLEDDRAAGSGGALDPPATGPTPEAVALAAERRRQIAAALEQLPERQRTVFVLSREQGYSSREVGSLMGMKESTVRVHLFRAIRKLRILLKMEADG